jgi:hypothetical protein
MKKFFFFFCTALVWLASAAAQTTAPGGIGPAGSGMIYRTSHYELIAEPGAESSLVSLGIEMEQRYDVYNSLFRFNPALFPGHLKVRVFMDPAAYDSYISTRLGAAKSGAIYLHYNNHDRRELVMLRGSPEEGSMLAHQSFIQFLRGHISSPPTWIREGFSIYFNSLIYDSQEQVLRYEENLAWLETVKSLGNDLLYPRQILLADTAANNQTAVPGGTAGISSRDLQICSWAFVSFLLFNDDHYRTMTESFMLLSPNSTAEENSLAVMERFSLWTDFYAMDREYAAYLDSRKTFAELMEGGRRFYDSGNAATAELYFLAARELRPSHYAPYYYLGLLCYDESNYDRAEEYYLLSIEYGADQALVSYALGVNAVSAGRNNAARTWLERAASLDPARYRTRAQDLIQRLR